MTTAIKILLALISFAYAEEIHSVDVVARTIGIEKDCLLIISEDQIQMLIFSQRLPVENSSDVDFANDILIRRNLIGTEEIASELALRYRDGVNSVMLAYACFESVGEDKRDQIQIELLTVISRLIQRHGISMRLIKR